MYENRDYDTERQIETDRKIDGKTFRHGRRDKER